MRPGRNGLPDHRAVSDPTMTASESTPAEGTSVSDEQSGDCDSEKWKSAGRELLIQQLDRLEWEFAEAVKEPKADLQRGGDLDDADYRELKDFLEDLRATTRVVEKLTRDGGGPHE